MAEQLSTRLSAKEGRSFAYTVGLAFAVFGVIAWWRGHSDSWKVFGTLSSLLLVAGTVIPRQLGPVQRAWMGLAHAISKVTTPIFMGVVYFLVITPIGLVMRLFGRQPMRHAERNGGFWSAPPSGGRSDMERQF